MRPTSSSTPVRLISFDKGTFWDLWGFFRRVVEGTRGLRPDVVHGYMDTGNIVAAALRLSSTRPKVVWGMRSSRLDLGLYDRAGRILFHLTRPVSRVADLIIANSSPGARDVIAAGYPARRVIVIHNGIDIERFRPDSAGAERFCREWKVPPGAPVVGMAGRLDLMKGHDIFTKAARVAAGSTPNRNLRVRRGGRRATPFRRSEHARTSRPWREVGVAGSRARHAGLLQRPDGSHLLLTVR